MNLISIQGNDAKKFNFEKIKKFIEEEFLVEDFEIFIEIFEKNKKIWSYFFEELEATVNDKENFNKTFKIKEIFTVKK